MDYDLYHDESKVDGYWHGILFIPTSRRQELLKLLLEARNNFSFQDPITFKGLKSKGKKFYLIRSWLSIATMSFVQYRKNKTMPYYTGKILFKSYRRSLELKDHNSVIGCKFVLFRVLDDHKNFNNEWLIEYASKVETTLRMAIKGGVHLLGGKNNPIHIKSLHLDGYEHYQRNIDPDRIFSKLSNLRDYCSISNEVYIDDRTGNHSKNDCQEFTDCQFLQLTDILVGSFRTILGTSTTNHQAQVSEPIRCLAERFFEGPARMRNSRYYKGYSFSQAVIENGKWEYPQFQMQMVDNNLSLFD